MKTKKEAYEAGYQSGRYAPNSINCHFSYFETKELSDEHTRGRNKGEKDKKAETLAKLRIN